MFLKCLLLSFLFFGCASKKIPAFDRKFYAFSIEDKAFVRKQTNEKIFDTWPEAGKMIAMKEEDWNQFFSTYVVHCQEWDETP